MNELPLWIWVLGLIGMVLGPTGAAWVGVKISLNGLRGDVTEVKTGMAQQGKDMSDARERIANIEGRLGL